MCLGNSIQTAANSKKHYNIYKFVTLGLIIQNGNANNMKVTVLFTFK